MTQLYIYMSFPGGSVDKESTCNAGDAGHVGSVPESGRSAGGGHGNPLQYHCLENPMDRGAWWVTVHRVSKSQTRLKWLSTAHTFFLTFFSIMVYYRIFSSLCYTVGSCCLSILICIWWSQIPSPSLGNNKSALSVSLFCREVHLCDILDSTYK